MEPDDRFVKIGRKEAQRSEPFDPDTRFFNDFIGREPELRLMMACWIAGHGMLPHSPLLVGEPGVGKNRLVYELARHTGRKLFILQGHEDITAEDLACTVRFSDRGAGMMDYMLSPLVTAMLEGGICFIDEIGKIRPRALALLVSVLDERRYIDSTLLGERVHAHPAFRFVAATNTNDINLLPEFILSRMRPRIELGFPGREDIDAIIRTHCQAIDGEVDGLIDLFWLLWKEHAGGQDDIAPREVLHLFGLASKLMAYDMHPGLVQMDDRSGETQPGLFTNCQAGIQPVHLRTAFRKLFNQSKSC